MWASKWILATQVLNRDIVADALSQFTERTSDSVSWYRLNRGMVVVENYKEFFNTPAIYVAIICLIYLIYTLAKNKDCHTFNALEKAVPYFLVGLAPVVWYVFAANHSAVHTWFTSKACVVTVLAIFFVEIPPERHAFSTNSGIAFPNLAACHSA